MQPTPLLVITGPTGVGKSALALELATTLGAEIVNADSVQLYRGFVIGASQPTAEDKAQVAHHLYEVQDPQVTLDVAGYIRLADQKIAELNARGMPSLVVGGTGLYLRALLHGLVDIPSVPDELVEEVRRELDDLQQQHSSLAEGAEQVRSWLAAEDSRALEQLNLGDMQRILRAVSVKRFTGRSLFDFHDEHRGGSPRYSALVVIVERSRESLYQRINQRVDQMWNEGLVAEVQGLLQQYGTSIHALGALGYRHVCEYLAGKYDAEQARVLMARDTRHFAKRQLTWWRNAPAKSGWQQIFASAEDLTVDKIVSEYRNLSLEDAQGRPPMVAYTHLTLG